MPAARAGRAEQERRDAGGRDDHPERERPDAAGRRLDRRVRELARREERGRDERRPRVDLPGVEQRARVVRDDEGERELEQRAPAARRARPPARAGRGSRRTRAARRAGPRRAPRARRPRRDRRARRPPSARASRVAPERLHLLECACERRVLRPDRDGHARTLVARALRLALEAPEPVADAVALARARSDVLERRDLDHREVEPPRAQVEQRARRPLVEQRRDREHERVRRQRAPRTTSRFRHA